MAAQIRGLANEMTARARLALRPSAAAFAPIPLVSLPCRVCGATSPAPEVVLTDGPVAYCTIDHARLHGWPWLQSEPRANAKRTLV